MGWNIQEMGPLYVPRSGDCIALDSTACRVYNKMIEYESGMRIREKAGKAYAGDSLIENYTFHTNWYFMGGDNMWNSQDSRYIGLIPEEFLIGKAVLVLTSKDPDTGSYQWRRFFKRIK